ncbi:Putative tetratricopeptide-like helical domain superfamily [Septoria linicola]|uniref:Tetratricopeptide-like helical domain superfamily n=1 Tax=Septoria linicola TaxID=215465 RepID=A0A9Q9AZR7_9PEZI|nr:putative tetratricopeptide-like helical domain superfamily [Septoria linicola]USW55510.1 Putative tetratricopeptide-like helical domain superfamily [Septoria linicola]
MASEAFWQGIDSERRRTISELIPPEQIEDQLPPLVHTQPVGQRQALLISILDAFAQAHVEEARQGPNNAHSRALYLMGALQIDIGKFPAAEETFRKILSYEDANHVDIAAREGLIEALASQKKYDIAIAEVEQLSSRIRATQGDDSPGLLTCSQMAERIKNDQLIAE